MDIGEKAVLFRLYLLLMDKPWNVFYNLYEPGCDIILMHEKSNKVLKIEVKTRQRLYTTGKNKNFKFQLTENEYQNINFLIAYWFEKNLYFIVPKEELKRTTSHGTPLYYIPIYEKADGTINEAINIFNDRWDLIKKAL